MRSIPALLACTALGAVLSWPLAAQASSRAFYLDIHRVTPGLEGHFHGVQDGESISFDVQKDLDLQKDTTQPGLALEYQGPRFGLELAADRQDYQGLHRLDQEITIDGTAFPQGTDLRSRMEVKNYTLNWTIRILRPDPFWIGVDLGIRAWDMDLRAAGENPLLPTISAQESFTLPIPQIGLSLGASAFERRLVARGFYHFLSRSGATYTHFGADVRVFPISWMGVRAFFDSESFKVPMGSIQDDLELKLDRAGAGFGLIVRL